MWWRLRRLWTASSIASCSCRRHAQNQITRRTILRATAATAALAASTVALATTEPGADRLIIAAEAEIARHYACPWCGCYDAGSEQLTGQRGQGQNILDRTLLARFFGPILRKPVRPDDLRARVRHELSL